MSKIAWMLIVLLVAASCSGSKTATVADSETPQIDLSGSDDLNETEDAEDIVTDASESNSESDSSLLSLDSNESSGSSATPEVSLWAKESKKSEIGKYVVQKNETLMMISFKLYGDYSKWRTLAKRNKKVVKNGIVLAGKTIKYKKPSQEFSWQPQGNPYLIKSGDTLGKISNDVYGSQKKWKKIWDNNRPLIKDPNRIFSGFTIYYLDQGSLAANPNSKLEL